MEILGDDGQVDDAARPSPGRVPPVRTPAAYARDTNNDRTGIPRRSAAPPAPAELDLGEQAPDPAWSEPPPRFADGPATGSLPAPQRIRAEALADDPRPDPRPGLRDPAPAEVPPEAAPEPEPEPPGLRDLVLSTVLAPEALGLTGLVLGFAAFTSTFPSVIAFSATASTAADQLRGYAYVYGLAGLLVIGLGVVAVLRLRPSGGSTSSRALAGASVLVGVALLLLAAYVVVIAGDIPTEPVEDVGG